MTDPSATAPRNLWRIILRNTAFASLSRILIKLANFATSIITARLLGEVAFGQYASIVAFVGMFGVFFELGLTQYAQRSIAQDARRTDDLLPTLVTLRLFLALAGIVVLTGLAIAIGHPPIIILGIFLVTLTFIPAALLMPLATVLAANERFDLLARVEIIARLLTILFTIAVLFAGGGLIGLLLSGIVVMPIQIAICWRAIRIYQLGNVRLRFDPSQWPAFIRAALPFGLTSLAFTFNYNADSVILSRSYPPEVVGWYNLAYGLVFSIVALTDGFLVSMTPSLAREHGTNPGQVQTWTRSSLGWLALFAFPACVGAALLAQPIIALLYGQQFAPSGPLLAVLAWDIPLMLFAGFCGNLTSAVNLERPAARIYLIASVLNVGLNLSLIPAYGAMAAAIITLLTDLLTVLLFIGLLGARMQLYQLAGLLLRISAATALMGAVIYYLHNLPLLLSIAIGVGVYVLAATIFGSYDRRLLKLIFGKLGEAVRQRS